MVSLPKFGLVQEGKISLRVKNEEIDRNGRNGPEWVSRGDMNCEGWSNEAIGNKMGLAWQRGRECLLGYLAGINLVSISTTLYFSFSFFIHFFLFSFLLIKFGFASFYFFIMMYLG